MKALALRIALAAIAALVAGFATAQTFTGTLTSADGKSKMEISATISGVVVAPPPVDPPPSNPPPSASSEIPLSFNDPRFSGNATSGSITVPRGGLRENFSITQTGATASVVLNGDGTLRNCRINSREAVRVGGSGTVTIDKCYLEATGQGNDHADTIQAYAPGSRGTIKVTNSAIVAHTTSATAGLFVADNWTGTVDLQNVVFWGGPFGLRLHADRGGDILLSLKDVFFVGPFGTAPHMLLDYGGKRVIIRAWENVRHATIQNGVLIPGAVIPRP